MTLEKINLVVTTVWRQENYLESTLNSLSSDQSISSDFPVSLVVGSPEITYLERYLSQPGISVIEMGPHTWAWIKNNLTLHRATWNYYRCLTYPVGGTRGTLIFEDDVQFARGWRTRLENTLFALEKTYGSDFVLALYTPSVSALKENAISSLYINYPYDRFFGVQGVYYPAKIRQSYTKHLKLHGVVGNEDHCDVILRKYLRQFNIPLFATSPSLIQHIGKTSEIQNRWHKASNFFEDVTTWPFKPDHLL